MKKNLLWPMYQSLENEFLQTSKYVMFDDDNYNVCSEKYIDILIRIWVEIESLSKRLYQENGGKKENNKELYFDTDCIDYLNEIWHICSKKIYVDSIYSFFEKEELKNICPLLKCNKRGTSGSKWKQAYQSVKHDRYANYKKANLKNCLMSLGALFLLNVYYKCENLINISLNEKNKFDAHIGSNLFVVDIDESLSTSFIQPSNESVLYVRINEAHRQKLNAMIEKSKSNVEQKLLEIIVNSIKLDDVQSDRIDLKKIVQDLNIDINKLQLNELKEMNFGREFNDLRIDILVNKQ